VTSCYQVTTVDKYLVDTLGRKSPLERSGKLEVIAAVRLFVVVGLGGGWING
jgi:hypothetical protein